MDFCVISPTAGLERYAVLSKTHLVLAHEWKGAYAEFYTERQRKDDFIILDNGAYEGSHIHFDEYVKTIYDVRPAVVVLPDFLLQPWKRTWHAAMYFLDQCYNSLPPVQYLYIPQAEPGDLHGFLESYTEAVMDPRISWIGIPRALAYAITDNPLMRVEFARMVRRDHPRIKLHAFGMVNGDVHELVYLEKAGVTSIDSSAPVWRGWHGRTCYMAEDRKWWDENGTPVDFNAPLSESLSIRYNLEACGIPTR